jgi:uncharacterized protein YwgA
MDRRQISSLLVLKGLGCEPILDSFSDRLILQKTIYLAQAAGVDLGYYYRWYLRGPYCPDVADDFFAARADPQGVEEARTDWTLDDKSKKKLAGIRALCGKNAVGPTTGSKPQGRARWLELLASVHYLVSRGQVRTHGPKAITTKLQSFNKGFSENEVSEALNRLTEAGLLTFQKR